MPRIILLLAIAVTLIVLIRRAQRQPPHKRRAAYLQIILGAAVIGVIILTLMGKMHWLGAAITGLLVVARQMLPLLIRLLPMLGSLRGQAQNGSKQSEVSSRLLKMTLDHDSGDLSGVVLEGPFRDWLLEELDRQQLDELLAFCQREDADSAQLLVSYLEQRFPDDAGTHEHGDAHTAQSPTGLTRAEALSLLGLQEGATQHDIVAAHRALIQKVHPDRGGSDYLAAKINEAKDFLLD